MYETGHQQTDPGDLVGSRHRPEASTSVAGESVPVVADERVCLVKYHSPAARCEQEPVLLVYLRCPCQLTGELWHHGRGMVCRYHLVDLMNGEAVHGGAVVELVHSEPIDIQPANEEST